MIDEKQNNTDTDIMSTTISSINSNCFICKNTLDEPLGCSNCQLLCCKLCLISFTIQNKKCPKGCTSFKLLFPNNSSHPKLYETIIECSNCKNLIKLVNYGIHIKKCFNKEKVKRCWNCNCKVPESSLVSKQFADYQLTANYLSEISLEEDKPFLMQITYNNVKGYITELNKRLTVTDNEKDACLFSQEQIDKLPYLKIFKKKVWKFLGPHYDQGILVVAYGRWAGSLILDVNKQTILSNSGRTQGLYLTMRKSDNRLFFFKENDYYTSCIVNAIPIISLDDIPQRHQS